MVKPFDGGENEAKWVAHGMPKGVVPDQYVAKCEAGGTNLHIYKLGFYRECSGCERQSKCQDHARCAGEQAEP